MNFEIIPLLKRNDLVDTCAAWSFSEWGCLIGDRTLEEVIAKYKNTMDTATLPITWVALCQDKLAGMVRLKMDDHPDRKDLYPWLGSLFVHSTFRGHGIGTALCKHVVKQAKEVYHFNELYLFTHTAIDFYTHLGWEQIDTVRDPTGTRPQGDALMLKREK